MQGLIIFNEVQKEKTVIRKGFSSLLAQVFARYCLSIGVALGVSFLMRHCLGSGFLLVPSKILVEGRPLRFLHRLLEPSSMR